MGVITLPPAKPKQDTEQQTADNEHFEVSRVGEDDPCCGRSNKSDKDDGLQTDLALIAEQQESEAEACRQGTHRGNERSLGCGKLEFILYVCHCCVERAAHDSVGEKEDKAAYHADKPGA